MQVGKYYTFDSLMFQNTKIVALLPLNVQEAKQVFDQKRKEKN